MLMNVGGRLGSNYLGAQFSSFSFSLPLATESTLGSEYATPGASAAAGPSSQQPSQAPPSSSHSQNPPPSAAAASEVTGQHSSGLLQAPSSDAALLPLEPPISSSEYSFSLDEQENLNDLFDLF